MITSARARCLEMVVVRHSTITFCIAHLAMVSLGLKTSSICLNHQRSHNVSRGFAASHFIG